MDKIPIIILNWNSFQDTKECILSILDNQQENFHIYLIDNGSEQDDINAIEKAFSNHPLITIKFNKDNLGFTKAHNQIFKELIHEQFPFLFVLNNDTSLPVESARFIENQKFSNDFGMVAFKMINYWDRNLMDNAGHQMLSSGEIIPIGHEESIKKYEESFENIGACAGATLYSTEMLKDIGFFDEYFETGYEDAELGLRAFIAGYKSIYEPEAIVFHKMGQSVKKIFNYHYTLKVQTNIFYTYLKLVHWQVLAINFIPFFLRFFLITIIDIIFWRPKYLKIQYHALYHILYRDIKLVWKARKEAKKWRRIPWWKLLIKQEFFLKRDIKSFYKFIIKGEKSYFEKY
ncbi:MAG: glycosyltransferase [Bacteroidales bacterium]|nr:glycosyltransferase [Bacteroidales bacterium]